jgi:enoyl-CoA hydratase
MTFNNLIYHLDQGVTTITINRPDKLNALNYDTVMDLNAAITAAQKDVTCKVIIITGSGEKAFVAGADIKEFSEYSMAQARGLAQRGHSELCDLIEQSTKPVIAAVNGFCLGGGLELAMSCHIRVASENAKMALPEVSLGVIPGYGGTQRLPQLIGKGRAFEMIMTGGMVDAQKALAMGLVNHVVEQESLMPLCHSIAEKMMGNSSLAIASAIKAINANYQDGVNGYQVEIDAFSECFNTNDFKEGTSAFINKRKANFPGN